MCTYCLLFLILRQLCEHPRTLRYFVVIVLTFPVLDDSAPLYINPGELQDLQLEYYFCF
jgi:hypothetical protein